MQKSVNGIGRSLMPAPENLIPLMLAYIFLMTLCHATNIFCLLLQSAYIYDTATYPHNPKDRKNS